MDGICTLANDRVYEQLIALLNSIEVIYGQDKPVCVYPYDDNTERIQAEIAQRPNVQLYSDRESMNCWDQFARSAWDTHPSARQRWEKAGSQGYHRFGTHRRYCAFDNPFDRFLYMDADTLLMNSVDFVFDQLNQYDCIVYDFQYKDPSHVYEMGAAKLTEVFPPERVKTEIFCSGFFAAKKNIFDEEKRQELIQNLENGEGEILYPMAPDQTLLNYIFMRPRYSIYNFALHLSPDEKTGCCVTSDHFQWQDHLLYDQGKQLTYLHYIGIPSQVFTRLCEGENVDFPYREVFLYYRYLKEPEKCPQFKGKPQGYIQQPSLGDRILRKLNLLKKG